jgi:glycine cleavage system H lipoate-binding protein
MFGPVRIWIIDYNKVGGKMKAKKKIAGLEAGKRVNE